MINVMIIGSGGRENALAWKLSQSPRLGKLYILPGNPGTAIYGTNLPLPERYNDLAKLALSLNVDLVVIGPEKLLADGLSDFLRRAGLRVFGPSSHAAQIESSKSFSKEFMKAFNIPTPKWEVFRNYNSAQSYLEMIDRDMPTGVKSIVIKASGLAGGKGVFLPETILEAQKVLQLLFVDKVLNQAANEIIIEERVSGYEVSLMIFTDGQTVAIMPAAHDCKRLSNHDCGPNTGGMGSYAPVVLSDETVNDLLAKVINPTIKGLSDMGRQFIGVLYAGLILTKKGVSVLEFNCRFGDPETQVVLPLLDFDLLDIMLACTEYKLVDIVNSIKWSRKSSACVVLASSGYPEKTDVGSAIYGLEHILGDVLIFNVGTFLKNNELFGSSGRILNIVGVSVNLESAVDLVYKNVRNISFDGMQYRTDIGQDLDAYYDLG